MGDRHEFLKNDILIFDICNVRLFNIILNSVRQHNHLITQGNYKATCFDYRLVILRPILSIVSQDAMHTLASHCVYIHGIREIKSFVSKGVTCKFARHALIEYIYIYIYLCLSCYIYTYI